MSGIGPVDIIGAQSGAGASDPGCKDGPSALRRRGLVARLARGGCSARWRTSLDGTPRVGETRVETAARFARRLAREVGTSLASEHFPVVLGGDHSVAIGTWSAVAQAWRPRGDLGLVWIDAHLDAHTPETSETGAPHGMPLAALLGHGPACLTGLAGGMPALEPEHLCLIGVRSYEAGEQALLRRLGVRIFYMEEVAARGFASCLDEALAHVARGTAALGVSIDLDALDPTQAPGTGCRVPHGIDVREAVDAMCSLAGRPGLAALELVEYDPHRDRDGVTAQAAEALLLSILARQATLPLAA